MCLMHDSDEYGVLRWPLRDIASAVNCKPADLTSLVAKGVLKGCDEGPVAPYIYIPRSGRKDGPAVPLIESQNGPLWFCSRMIRDEYVRRVSGASTRFQAASNEAPMAAPRRRHGDRRGAREGAGQGDGSTSSSTSSAKTNTPPPPNADAARGAFDLFWKAWPSHPRKVAKDQCRVKWKAKGCDGTAEAILSSVEAAKQSEAWLKEDGAYIPTPLVWLNQSRWEAPPGPPPAAKSADIVASGEVQRTQALLAAQAAVTSSPEARQEAMARMRKTRAAIGAA